MTPFIINFILKLECKDNKHLIWEIKKLNFDTPTWPCWIASTTFLESVLKTTFVNPLWASYWAASINAKASPSITNRFPCFHEVLAKTYLSMQSWTHHHYPTPVIPKLLYKLASTLHLNNPEFSFLQEKACSWRPRPDVHTHWTSSYSLHIQMALTPSCWPTYFALFHT
jgi:hypothetical protein